jgi:Mn2+/Fe2+ NRAMP family transporter
MVAIQLVAARIGRVTGKGVIANARTLYPTSVVSVLVGLIVIANTINIAADLAAMAEAVKLVVGGPRHLYAVVIGFCCLILQVFVPYQRYLPLLKWLTLSLFAYVGTVFASNIEWGHVIVATFVPHISFRTDYVLLLVGVFGTTISPYLFFWQAGEEVEDIQADQSRASLINAPDQAPKQLKRIKWDTIIGMGFSNLIAFFIILTTAATLFPAGIHNIQTSADAALALRPIAGEFTFLLFALGILGTGLLAIPVLAGSAAYALAELIHKPASLSLKPAAAKSFYMIISIATLFGLALVFSDIDPIKALLWSAVINGIVAVPIMITLMHMASKPSIMGIFVVGIKTKVLGWMATTLMTVAAFVLMWVYIR